MHWKLKALIQRMVSSFGSDGSYAAYYWLQKHFGRVGGRDPSYGLFVGVETWKRLLHLGKSPRDKVFFEVGTGRVPMVPMAYYLMGALQTVTVDLNPYLKEELVVSQLKAITSQSDKVRPLFGGLLVEERWAKLVELAAQPKIDVAEVLDVCGIRYTAPADAADTHMPSASIDYHTSNTTLEHIPRDPLIAILREGRRLLKKDGLFAHRIDYSDHFAHTDKHISLINFLQYSDKQWARYADNRYMYMNRFRHDDLLNFFEASGLAVIEAQIDMNEDLLRDLADGKIKVDSRFAAKDPRTLATTGAWILAAASTGALQPERAPPLLAARGA